VVGRGGARWGGGGQTSQPTSVNPRPRSSDNMEGNYTKKVVTRLQPLVTYLLNMNDLWSCLAIQ
jgi:hypothetical protein